MRPAWARGRRRRRRRREARGNAVSAGLHIFYFLILLLIFIVMRPQQPTESSFGSAAAMYPGMSSTVAQTVRAMGRTSMRLSDAALEGL